MRMIHLIQTAVCLMRREVQGSVVKSIQAVVMNLILIVMLRGSSRLKRSGRYLSTARKVGWRIVMILILMILMTAIFVQGFNGADLRNVCTEAGMAAIRAERDYVIHEDFMKVSSLFRM